MLLEYIAAEILIFAITAKLIGDFLKNFNLSEKIIAMLLFPLLLFSFGFALRLSGSKEMIDIGFFFTEFRFLFVYLIFAAALVLGQIKYWHRKKD